jgi:hypothetical protein
MNEEAGKVICSADVAYLAPNPSSFDANRQIVHDATRDL